jgi:hypothetical protein
MTSIRSALFGTLLVAAVATSGAAQTSGSIQATATVLSALTVAGTTNLAFGNVAPTQTKTVAPAAGGLFTVGGSAAAPVLVSFTLPATLGANVAIGTWQGLANTVNNAGTATALTVSAVPQARTIGGVVGTGNLFVWVGATLTTTAAAPAAYTAPVTLTVIYN